MKGIPFSVGKFLMEAIARVRRIYLVRGFAAVGIVWLLGIVAVMVVDSRIVIFDDRIRWAMTAGAALLALLAAMGTIVVPLRRRLDLRRMAAILDQRHPEQEERLSTLVELSESDAAKAGFSASLFALVCDLAEDDVSKLDLNREFPLLGAWRRLGVFALMLLALGIGSAVSPSVVGLLFVRAIAPWADIGNLFSNEIIVKPGDLIILSGSVIRIEAAAKEECTIRISRRTPRGWGEETVETMAGGVYETTADLNEREWRYRVTAGHAVTRYYYVRVSQMPKYDLFTATVEFPAYTRMRPLVLSNADVTAISAIQGSRVKFDIRVSDPGTLVDFRINKEPVFEHTMVSNRTANWSLDLVNSDGFRAEKGRHPLKSFIDQPPTLVVENPSGKLPKLPPHAKIPVELTGSDDVYLLPPKVRCAIDDGEMRELREVADFASAGGNLWRGKTELDLARLDLTTAHRVRFDFVTSDTCPPQFGGPHVVTSSVINVELEYQQWGFEVTDLAQQKKDADSLIREASDRLRTAERLARELANEFRREGPVSDASERKNESAAHEASEARKRLHELHDRFEDDERFAPLVKPLEKTIVERVSPAAESIESSPFRDRGDRAPEMERAADDLRAAVDELRDLGERLGVRFDKVEALEKAKDLAERQDALAKAAKDILAEKPKDPAKLEAWKRLEQEAMRRVEELSRNLPDADFAEAKRKMETAARKMEALARDVDRASKRLAAEKKEAAQREEAEKKDAARAAQELAAAAADQKRAEDALRQKNAPAAQAAQRTAEQHLEKGEATPAVEAFQKLASDVARKKDVDEALAAETQHAANEALEKERALREAIAKGEKKPEDLRKLDAELRQDYQKQAESVAQAEKASAAAREQERKADEEALRRAEESVAKGKDEKAAAAQAKELEAAAAAQQAAEDAIKSAAKNRAAAIERDGANDHAAAAQNERDAKAADAKATQQQKQAADALTRGGATEGVKAMQKMAAEAEQDAQAMPDSTARAEAAAEAQHEAAEALKAEQALRKEIAAGTKTAEDLKKLDRDYQRKAAGLGEERTENVQSQELAEAAAAQQAAEASMKAAAAERQAGAEARRSGDSQTGAERDKAAKTSDEQAGSAQKAATDALKRGGATEGVRQMQKAASEAGEVARKSPRSAAKASAARDAQQAAALALEEERDLRAAMAKGEKTEADLDELDRRYRKEAERISAANAKAFAEENQADKDAASAAAASAKELAAAAADQQRAAQALQRNDFKNAAAAQRGAEDHLERAEATEPVKALQQMASEAARAAAKAPQTAEKTAAAQALQKRASEALAKEQAVRAAMAKGEMTAEDLAALEDALRGEAKELAAQRTASAKEAAGRALEAAKAAIGSEDQEKIDQLADAALEAKRDELGAVLEESKLNDNDALADAAREALDAMDAAEAADAAGEALEKKILSGQQQALEAMKRNDRGRAANLQREIAKAQARAAESSLGSDDADEARAEANEAQEAAQEQMSDANGNWNDKTRGEAVAAQEKAMEAERTAQGEARAARTMDKIASAEKQLEQAQSGEQSQSGQQAQSGEQSSSQAAQEAAQDAADAMTREVNAQATALGMSRQGKGEKSKGGKGKGKKDEKDKSLSAGGGIADEVSHLASELKRNDNPDFLKSLFTRLGWFKIRGISKDGVGDRDLKDVPREYRDLVRRYFLKLSEENP